MKAERWGIINIGASAFRMHIAEYQGKEARELDYIIKPLRLGDDTFKQGYISLDNVKMAAEILEKFHSKLKEFDVQNYRAMCTSGVREAINRDFFIDYVFINSGIRLEILDPYDEIYLKYVGVKNDIKQFDALEKEGLVFANISSGNVTLNITNGNTLYYAGALPFGSLRLMQIFRAVPQIQRHKAVEEYIEAMLEDVFSSLPAGVELNHLAGTGSSVNLLARIFGADAPSVSKRALLELYSDIKMMSEADIVEIYRLREDEAIVIVPMLATYLTLMEMIKAKEIVFSKWAFPRIMSLYYSGRIIDKNAHVRFYSTLQSIAKKFQVDIHSARRVLHFAKRLFNGLQELHFLSNDSFNILYAAVMLHDVSNYLMVENIAWNSYHIINSLRLPGVDTRLFELAACVVYDSGMRGDTVGTDLLSSLSSAEKTMVRKLAGLLRVARAMDISRKRRIHDIELIIEDRIIVSATAKMEPYLEVYEFNRIKKAFVDTFGVDIDLRVRIKYD